MSARVRAIKAFATSAVGNQAPELKATGEVIDKALSQSTAPDGLPSFKDAKSGKFIRDNPLGYEREDIVKPRGAKHSIYSSVRRLQPALTSLTRSLWSKVYAMTGWRIGDVLNEALNRMQRVIGNQ